MLRLSFSHHTAVFCYTIVLYTSLAFPIAISATYKGKHAASHFHFLQLGDFNTGHTYLTKAVWLGKLSILELRALTGFLHIEWLYTLIFLYI